MENKRKGAIIEYQDTIIHDHGINITPSLPIATAVPNPVVLNLVGYSSVVN